MGVIHLRSFFSSGIPGNTKYELATYLLVPRDGFEYSKLLIIVKKIINMSTNEFTMNLMKILNVI